MNETSALPEVPGNAVVWLLRAPPEGLADARRRFGDHVTVRDGPQTDELADVAILWLRPGDDVLSALLVGSESLEVGGRLWVVTGGDVDLDARVEARARTAELDVRGRLSLPWGRALDLAPRTRRQPWMDL